jgi:hypothetical protein
MAGITALVPATTGVATAVAPATTRGPPGKSESSPRPNAFRLSIGVVIHPLESRSQFPVVSSRESVFSSQLPVLHPNEGAIPKPGAFSIRARACPECPAFRGTRMGDLACTTRSLQVGLSSHLPVSSGQQPGSQCHFSTLMKASSRARRFFQPGEGSCVQRLKKLNGNWQNKKLLLLSALPPCNSYRLASIYYIDNHRCPTPAYPSPPARAPLPGSAR